jgi:predicted DNA-binding protein with PD1-like motif
MRRLVQPGPVHPSRIVSFRGKPLSLGFVAQPGSTLNEALTAPLVAAGWQSGTLSFAGLAVDPFRYVMPGPADDGSHVAYFSAPRAPVGMSRIERGNATFGWAGGQPFVHCHAAWTEPDGARRGGHILPHETVVASETTVWAWGCADVRSETAFDAETNFTLFQPTGRSWEGARGVVARVRPNEDITSAVEAIARTHGMPDAIIRGSLGSLVGARFTDGRSVTDDATEVLVREGRVQGGLAELDLIVVDMGGRVHEGRLARGENAVLITFDLVLEAADGR